MYPTGDRVRKYACTAGINMGINAGAPGARAPGSGIHRSPPGSRRACVSRRVSLSSIDNPEVVMSRWVAPGSRRRSGRLSGAGCGSVQTTDRASATKARLRGQCFYRHALNAWASPLATCALPKGVCYLLTYYLRGQCWRVQGRSGRVSGPQVSPGENISLGLAFRRKLNRSKPIARFETMVNAGGEVLRRLADDTR